LTPDKDHKVNDDEKKIEDGDIIEQIEDIIHDCKKICNDKNLDNDQVVSESSV
jgi:hypothetical protein